MIKKKISNISVGLIIILIIWQVFSMILNRSILPSPVNVIPLFLHLLKGELGVHFLASFARVLASMILSLLFAIPAGLILGQNDKINSFFDPIIAVLYPIPKIVFLPIVYLLLGISDISKIFLICLILFFQILVVVRDEAHNLPKELILSARSLGAKKIDLFWRIYGPASIPGILTSLRVSIGTTMAVLFLTEQSLTEYGLGYFILVKSYQILKYKEMYAGIIAISLLGALFYLIIDLMERLYKKDKREFNE